MKRLAYTSILIALLTSTASVQAQAPQRQGAGPAARISTSIPASSMTVTHWYKQNVYDPGDNKIGEIKDVLVDPFMVELIHKKKSLISFLILHMLWSR